jgi:hypothetical protein
MFDVNRVTSVYSGRKGCACGCRGNYTYSCREAQPSYYKEDESNPKTVKMMARKVARMVADPNSNVQRVMVDDEWFAVDMDNDRTYTVYFRGGLK